MLQSQPQYFNRSSMCQPCHDKKRANNHLFNANRVRQTMEALSGLLVSYGYLKQIEGQTKSKPTLHVKTPHFRSMCGNCGEIRGIQASSIRFERRIVELTESIVPLFPGLKKEDPELFSMLVRKMKESFRGHYPNLYRFVEVRANRVNEMNRPNRYQQAGKVK